MKLHIGRAAASQGSQEFELLQRLVVEGSNCQSDLETAVKRSKQNQQEVKEALERVLREQSKEETEARRDNQPTAEVGPSVPTAIYTVSLRDGDRSSPRPIIRSAAENWTRRARREARYADSGLSLQSSPPETVVPSSPHPFDSGVPSSPLLPFERAVSTSPPSRLESEIPSVRTQQEARSHFSPLSSYQVIDRYPRPNSPFLEIETLPDVPQGARNHFSSPSSLVRQDARNRFAPLSRSREANDRSSQPNSPHMEFETLPSALQESRNPSRSTSAVSPQVEVNNRAPVEKLVSGRKRRVR